MDKGVNHFKTVNIFATRLFSNLKHEIKGDKNKCIKKATIDCIVNKEASEEERGTLIKTNYVRLFLAANVKQNFGNSMEPDIAR